MLVYQDHEFESMADFSDWLVENTHFPQFALGLRGLPPHYRFPAQVRFPAMCWATPLDVAVGNPDFVVVECLLANDKDREPKAWFVWDFGRVVEANPEQLLNLNLEVAYALCLSRNELERPANATVRPMEEDLHRALGLMFFDDIGEPHNYRGGCPDEEHPDQFNAACPRCRAESIYYSLKGKGWPYPDKRGGYVATATIEDILDAGATTEERNDFWDSLRQADDQWRDAEEEDALAGEAAMYREDVPEGPHDLPRADYYVRRDAPRWPPQPPPPPPPREPRRGGAVAAAIEDMEQRMQEEMEERGREEDDGNEDDGPQRAPAEESRVHYRIVWDPGTAAEPFKLIGPFDGTETTT